MTEPPRRASSGLLGAREYLGIATVGLLMGGLALACYLWPWQVEADVRPEFARAMAFSLLALAPLFHALNCRSPTVSIFSMRPMVPSVLFAAIVTSAGIHLVTIVVPVLRGVFHTFPLGGLEWFILVALAASVIPIVELIKASQRLGFVGRRLEPIPRTSS